MDNSPKIDVSHVKHEQPVISSERGQSQSFREGFRGSKQFVNSWISIDHKAILFEFMIIVTFIIGVIHFAQTRDTSVVMSVLTYIATYVGLNEVKTLLPSKGKKE